MAGESARSHIACLMRGLWIWSTRLEHCDTAEYTQGWNHDKNGWWYADTKSTYYKSCWQIINGHKYYFNPDGYAITGWQEIDGKWYYFEPRAGTIWNVQCMYPISRERSSLENFRISEIVLNLFGKVTNCPD